MKPRFDFSSFFLNATLSDVVIAIKAGSAEGNVHVEELPSHGIVLANVSELFKQQIEQQSHKHTIGSPAIITLDCAADQVPAARALVKYIYQGSLPDTSSGANETSQPLLVQMLHLSHKYAVVDCTRSCLAALMSAAQLQLDTVHLVLSLLPTGADFQPLIKHALNHLQQQLGDLEATMRSPALLASFQRLPHSALLGLLRDERTSAASENTVLAAVQSWLSHQPATPDNTHLQQLAATIRVPLLEPAYLTTVLPRIPWLLEVLGYQGLAMAAGAARGLFDPHAEPCLSNPRACRVLATEWGRGPRPLPASCCKADGPEATWSWSLPIEDIRRAFQEACLAAAATGNTFEAAAAIGSRVASPVPLSHAAAAAAGAGTGADTGGAAAATVQRDEAAAPAAAAAGTAAAAGVLPPLARTSSNMAAAALSVAAGAVSYGASIFRKRGRSPDVDDKNAQDQQQQQQQRWPPRWTARSAAAADGGEEESNEKPGQKRNKRQCRGAVQAGREEPGHVPAAGLGCAQPADKPAAADTAVAPAVPAAQAAGRQQCWPRPWKLRSPEVAFAGYNWRLVLYFQAREQQQQPTAAAAAGGSSQQTPPPAAAARRVSRRSSAPAAQGAAARQAVAAAAALSLPDEQQQCSWVWQARLAIEAEPCMLLQPGVSVAAFSGSLAVQLNRDMLDLPRGDKRRHHQVGVGAGPVGLAGRRHQQQQQQKRHGLSATEALAAVAAAGGRVGPGGHGLMAAATTTGGARGPRSSSSMLVAPDEDDVVFAGHGSAAAAGHRSPSSRRAAAVAAAAKIVQQQSGLMLPDSNMEEEEEEQQQQQHVGAGEGSDDEDDEDAQLAGMFSAEGDAAAAAAAGRFGSPGGVDAGASSAGGSSCSAVGSDGDELDEPAAGGAAGGRAGGGGRRPGSSSGSGSGWQVFQLPQGSWVKSRKCDTGFRDFFGITLAQGQWDESAWVRYMQPGGVVQLKARIWNVR